MGYKVNVLLGLFLATFLLISSEVAGRQLEETRGVDDSSKEAGVDDAKYPGGYGGYPRWGGEYPGGEYPIWGGGYPGGGYPRWGGGYPGGGYPRWGGGRPRWGGYGGGYPQLGGYGGGFP